MRGLWKKPLPAAEYLRSILSYDPESGALKWRWRDDAPDRINTRTAGTTAGSSATTKGRYVRVKIDRTHYAAHRIIFKMMTGRDPVGIDHVDNDGLNNRWSNLREAVAHQNACNRRTRSRVYPRGVQPYQGYPYFRADIQVRGKSIYLGRYDTVEEAAAAYAAASKKYHGRFGRTA